MLETDTQTDFVEIRFAAGLPGFPHVHMFQLSRGVRRAARTSC